MSFYAENLGQNHSKSPKTYKKYQAARIFATLFYQRYPRHPRLKTTQNRLFDEKSVNSA